MPVWTPDGKRIVFTSDRAKLGSSRNLYWVSADGTGQVTRLTDSPDEQYPASWHPSGKFLGFTENRARTGWDVHDPADGGRRGRRLDGRHTHSVARHAGDTRTGRCFRRMAGSSRTSRPKAAAPTTTCMCVRSRVPAARGACRRTGGMLSPLVGHDARAVVGRPWPSCKVMFAPFSIVGDAFVPGEAGSSGRRRASCG